MGQVTVLDGGLFTTIQDEGRLGYRKYGVPTSGAMDQLAYRYANELVQNSLMSPALECTLIGGTYHFGSEACIAITGADMKAEINGNAVPKNKTLFVEKGDILSLKSAVRGNRTYIGIRGEWNLQPVLGSFSTNTQSVFGGFDGRSLQKGDVLDWMDNSAKTEAKSIEKDRLPYYSSKRTIEIQKGPEFEWLSESMQKLLLNTLFTVSSKSDRMALRLESESKLEYNLPQMKSSPVMPGIIQLPPNGNPIILMRDAQTVGGYPRIAIISEFQLSVLAQIPFGGILKFSVE